jgi:hypothetical protein
MITTNKEDQQMTREDELKLLHGMARCFEANTGKLPTTVKEIGDHWYDMSDVLVSRDPPMTVFEIDTDHCRECIWLREIEKRADADALLAEALAMATAEERANESYFGGCPQCGKNDGYVNAGRTHIFFCKAHRTKWIFGANIFSDWRDQTEDEQRRVYDEIGLGDFTSVEPLATG